MKKVSNRIEPIDLEFVPVDPNPNFDPERNRRIIRETIEKNERRRRQILRDNDAEIKERANAIGAYLKNIERGGNTTNIFDYFGRRYMAKLRGEEILARLKDGLTVKDKDGRVLRKPGF